MDGGFWDTVMKECGVNKDKIRARKGKGTNS